MNKTVRIDEIDVGDTSCCISYPLDDELLASSIGRFGVIVPVALLENDPTKLVIGFRRVAAAGKAGIEKVPCVFLDVDARQALLIAIYDNIKRPLNTIEKALCIEKMGTSGFPPEDILAVAKMIGLPTREKTLATAAGVGSLGTAAKDLIVQHSLSLPVVEQLLSFNNEEIDAIVGLMDGVRLTTSNVREALHLFMLLKIRNGRIDFGYFQGSAGGETMVGRLKREAYPLLTGLEERLAQIKAASALPPHIRLNVDPVFEKESIDIHVRARNEAEVEEALKRLDALSDRGIFRRLFELTHGS
jgi:hypothetical protein